MKADWQLLCLGVLAVVPPHRHHLSSQLTESTAFPSVTQQHTKDIQFNNKQYATLENKIVLKHFHSD